MTVEIDTPLQCGHYADAAATCQYQSCGNEMCDGCTGTCSYASCGATICPDHQYAAEGDVYCPDHETYHTVKSLTETAARLLRR